jgi:hypothetical protein
MTVILLLPDACCQCPRATESLASYIERHTMEQLEETYIREQGC